MQTYLSNSQQLLTSHIKSVTFKKLKRQADNSQTEENDWWDNLAHSIYIAS